MTIQPSKARYRVAEKNNSLYILFKQPFTFGTYFSTAFTLVIFIIIFLSIIYSFLEQGDLSDEGVNMLTFVWVTIIILAVTIVRSFCRIFGSELVVVNQSKLSVITQCFKWRRVKSFDIAHIRNLHAGTKGKIIESKLVGISRVDNGVVDFDYGATTYSIGFKLSGPEIRDLIIRIKNFIHISDADELEVSSIIIDDDRNIPDEISKDEVSLKKILRHH